MLSGRHGIARHRHERKQQFRELPLASRANAQLDRGHAEVVGGARLDRERAVRREVDFGARRRLELHLGGAIGERHDRVGAGIRIPKPLVVLELHRVARILVDQEFAHELGRGAARRVAGNLARAEDDRLVAAAEAECRAIDGRRRLDRHLGARSHQCLERSAVALECWLGRVLGGDHLHANLGNRRRRHRLHRHVGDRVAVVAPLGVEIKIGLHRVEAGEELAVPRLPHGDAAPFIGDDLDERRHLSRRDGAHCEIGAARDPHRDLVSLALHLHVGRAGGDVEVEVGALRELDGHSQQSLEENGRVARFAQRDEPRARDPNETGERPQARPPGAHHTPEIDRERRLLARLDRAIHQRRIGPPRVARELDGRDQPLLELGIVAFDQKRRVFARDAHARPAHDPPNESGEERDPNDRRHHQPHREWRIEEPIQIKRSHE